MAAQALARHGAALCSGGPRLPPIWERLLVDAGGLRLGRLKVLDDRGRRMKAIKRVIGLLSDLISVLEIQKILGKPLFLPSLKPTRSCSPQKTKVVAGPQVEGDQEGHWVARRLDKRPGNPEDTREAIRVSCFCRRSNQPGVARLKGPRYNKFLNSDKLISIKR